MKSVIALLLLCASVMATDGTTKELTAEQQLKVVKAELQFMQAQQAEKDAQDTFQKLQAEFCGNGTDRLSKRADGNWTCSMTQEIKAAPSTPEKK